MYKRQKTGEPRSLLSLFLTTPVNDHIPRDTTGDVISRKVGPVLVVQPEESLPRAMRKLVVEGFLSAPVVSGNRYLGFIDMMDLVQKTRNLFWADTVEAWTDFWEKEDKFSSTTVDDVMKTPNQFERDPAPPIGEHFSTFSALETIVRNKLHRLAVVEHGSSNKLCNILTESMLISWLRQNKELLGTLRRMRVSDITDELKGPCETIKESEKAVNAFNRMANLNISGLAVVDKEGVLVSGISIRDLRTIGTSGEFFHRLFRTVKEFKQLTRDEHPKLAPRTHYSRTVTPKSGRFVTPSSTFEDVLNKMADGNIHRIFVCDSVTRPVPTHCISQGDMLKLVLDQIIHESEELDVSMTSASG